MKAIDRYTMRFVGNCRERKRRILRLGNQPSLFDNHTGFEKWLNALKKK